MDKILIHINSLGKGGAERVVSLLSGRFVRDGIEVVIATEWEAAEEYPLKAGVRRIHVGLSEGEQASSSLRKQWLRLLRLRSCIRRERPDCVLSFCVKANYRAALASLGSGSLVVVSVRSDPKVEYTGIKKHWMNKLALNRAAGCVFQTEEARDFFDRPLREKSRIICNPVNEGFLAAKRLPAAKKIVSVGRLTWEKNQLLLIRAFERIKDRYPGYGLYFYGDGEEDGMKKDLEAYVRKQGLGERIHFMGLSRNLERDIADAAMFVLSSDHEGMPNALMEAMALGLPVISTDCPCGGSRRWIASGENGLLTPVGDAEALAEAMEYLLEHEEEAARMGERARERLGEASLDKVYGQWKSYLAELVSGRKN